MKKLTKIIFTFGLGSFLCACVASNKDISELKTQIALLNQNIAAMQENQADLSYKMDELSTDINVANENMKETSIQLTRLSSRLDDLSVATTAVAEAKELALPTQIFDNARVSILDGKYDSAIEGFNLYLTKYPKGEFAEEAQTNIGDAYYAKKDWKNAAVAYAKNMQNYPKSKSMPSYRLKYARSILPLNKKTEAKKYLQSIVQDYPKSSEAKIAKKELEKFK
ncbi:tol-pal system protein YbgF [Elusimicrobium posterum]|uniref:tol-pal system protein YbgF n=1 Tax=Elusimicrobium posterum TaxID=3116653 RepID=UPI003C76FE73